MKILMITSSYLPSVGGIEYHIQDLFKKLKKDLDTKVDIAEINLKYKNFKIDHKNDVSIFRVPAKGKFPFIFFKKLSSLINNFDYDIIHIHDPQVAGLSFHFLLNNYKTPLILATHGGMFHTNGNSLLKKLYWNIITKNLINIYSKVVCISKNDLNIFSQIVSKEKILLIENGVDYEKFNLANNYRTYKQKRFVYFGRFSQNKQVHLIVDAFNNLSTYFEDIELLIIGNTDDIAYKNLLNEKSKDNKSITIINFLEDKELLEELRKSDFFITASNYEGFGMSVLESMSAGLIPIVNNISPLNELVDDNINGFVVDFEDKQQTHKSLKKIIQLSASELSEISKKSLEKSYKFSWQVKSESYKELYSEL